MQLAASSCGLLEKRPPEATLRRAHRIDRVGEATVVQFCANALTERSDNAARNERAVVRSGLIVGNVPPAGMKVTDRPSANSSGRAVDVMQRLPAEIVWPR